ncbi:MAG: heme ABC transporter ATP-binding protein [Bacterioplanes sp.]|nr:heme ABC transporter ATP-binding protein [Bacterioplanes sp.]
MLAVRSLSVSLPKKPYKTLLQNISFDLACGEKLAVLGANGAGKSTLLRCISGELTTYQGTICLANKPLTQWQPMIKARHLAVMPQSVVLSFPFRVDQVVAMGRAPYADEEQTRDWQQQAMQMTDVWHLRLRSYSSLSGGEQQRVQLARVFVQIWHDQQQPVAPDRCLLLDECTSALDPAHQYSLMAQVSRIANEGVAVLAVMHDMGLAASWADRVLILKQGSVMAYGDVHLLHDHQVLAQAYDLPSDLAQRYARWHQSEFA